jgi:hypothetical protein
MLKNASAVFQEQIVVHVLVVCITRCLEAQRNQVEDKLSLVRASTEDRLKIDEDVALKPAFHAEASALDTTIARVEGIKAFKDVCIKFAETSVGLKYLSVNLSFLG